MSVVVYEYVEREKTRKKCQLLRDLFELFPGFGKRAFKTTYCNREMIFLCKGPDNRHGEKILMKVLSRCGRNRSGMSLQIYVASLVLCLPGLNMCLKRTKYTMNIYRRIFQYGSTLTVISGHKCG